MKLVDIVQTKAKASLKLRTFKGTNVTMVPRIEFMNEKGQKGKPQTHANCKAVSILR